MKLFMGSNIFLSMFLIALLQFLWGFVNTIQVVVITVLFNVNFPLNAVKIFIIINKLTSLDLIEVDDYIKSFMRIHQDTVPLNIVFEDCGYESSSFTVGLGMAFFFTLFAMLFFCVKTGLKHATRRCGDNFCSRKIRQPINLAVVIVRFNIESCIMIALTALITISMTDMSRFSHAGDAIDVFLAYFTII